MSIATRCVDGVCLCVLPLERNDWRPLALRHRSLAFVSALLIAVKAIALLTVAVTPTVAELSTITGARVVQLTNAERHKAGQSQLKVSPQLTQAAQRKGEDMLTNDYFAHISPSGVTPWVWMQQQGYTYQIAGENLAIDFVEVEDVVAAWMASPSHRDNMLHEAYTEMGVAVVTGEFQGGTSTIVVHMFGLPTSPATASAKQAAPTTTPTPSPAALPAPPPDTTPPRAPRIALAGGTTSTVVKTATVSVDTEVDTVVTLFVNNVQLTNGIVTTPLLELDVSQFPDGPLRLEASAKDPAGNTSARSDAVSVQKDSAGPALERSAATFVLGPQTDVPVVLASVASSDAVRARIEAPEGSLFHSLSSPIVLPVTAGEIVIAVIDEVGNSSDSLSIALLPHYTVDSSADDVVSPTRLDRLSRWIMALVVMIVMLFLALAILVRLSIQRPALIAHASLVLLLALTLFIW